MIKHIVVSSFANMTSEVDNFASKEGIPQGADSTINNFVDKEI